MNVRRRGAPGKAPTVVKANEGRDGGDKKSYSYKHGMERHGPKPMAPEKSAQVIEHPA
jgi:hypothetical protein